MAEHLSLGEIHKYFWLIKRAEMPGTTGENLDCLSKTNARIEGINYFLKENLILSCLDDYCVSEKLDEDAVVTSEGEFVLIKLDKSNPSILP